MEFRQDEGVPETEFNMVLTLDWQTPPALTDHHPIKQSNNLHQTVVIHVIFQACSILIQIHLKDRSIPYIIHRFRHAQLCIHHGVPSGRGGARNGIQYGFDPRLTAGHTNRNSIRIYIKQSVIPSTYLQTLKSGKNIGNEWVIIGWVARRLTIWQISVNYMTDLCKIYDRLV